MRSLRRLAVLGLALAGAGWLACGGGGPDAEETLRLVANDWSPASGAPLVALQRVQAGRELSLEAVAARRSPKGWRVWELREPGGASPLARLALATDEAALLLYAVARDRELAFAIAPNRLVRLAVRDDERLALWLDAEAESSLAATADLDLDEAAPLVAAAQALGGWRAVANDRYPVASDGVAHLPLFVPAPIGDWRALRLRSLEFFLPPALGRSFVTRPGFRAARDLALAGYAQGLPRLSESVARVAEGLPEAEHGAVAAALAEQLNETAAALAGYLDSTWIELAIERTGAAAARVRVLVHSVVDLRIEALQAELPGKVLVTESASLAGLRLAPVGEGDALRAHLGQDRLEFRIDRAVTPAASGVETFRTTSLAYALTGLASLGPAAAPLLEGLRVRATNAATGAPVPDSHVHRLLSVAAERFEIGVEPGIEAFLAALPRVLLRSGGGGPAELRLDRRARMLALPAGDYHVVADFVPPADFGLVLDAGVSIRVDPGRSLLIRGPLEVRGSAEKPVRVLAAQPAAPWGVLALQGRGRSALSAARPRSELRHLELSGGSQDQLKGVAYEGQLSVHHQDFTLQHGVLSRAFAGAALSVKHGRVDLRDSVFVDNQSDAVDLVRAEGRAERCFFGRSGQDGDGLDLTATSLAVADSVFSGLRDECVSVGAASTLRLRGSLLRGCDLALASRDGSHAEVTDSLFLDNERNFAAGAKREGFGAATIRGRRLLLVAGSKPDARDRTSTIELEDATTIAHPEESGLALDALRKAPSFSSARFGTLSPAPR